MAKVKYDGVVEAVRYKQDDRIDWVRIYLKRGPTFSDRILLDRQSLLDELKSGKKIMVGERVKHWAGTFEVSDPVSLVENNSQEYIVVGKSPANRDHLEGVPII